LSNLFSVVKLRAVQCAADAVTATEKHMNVSLHITVYGIRFPVRKWIALVFIYSFIPGLALKYATVTSFYFPTNILQAVRVKKRLGSRSGQ
jgi:hypothetical protein